MHPAICVVVDAVVHVLEIIFAVVSRILIIAGQGVLRLRRREALLIIPVRRTGALKIDRLLRSWRLCALAIRVVVTPIIHDLDPSFKACIQA
jgi:hypothetical protein